MIEEAVSVGSCPDQYYLPGYTEDGMRMVQECAFDNAGTWGPDFDARHSDGTGEEFREISVVLRHDGEPVAEVNLATLFAWATDSSD